MIVVFPIIPWGFMRQRPQHVVSGLGAAGCTVFYLAPTSEPWVKLHSACGVDGVAIESLSPGVFHVWIYTAAVLDIHGPEGLAGAHDEFCGRLQRLLNVLEVSTPVYLLQHPQWLPVVSAVQAAIPGALVYDCMDEHAGFPGAPAHLNAREAELFRQSSWTITSAALLEAKARGFTQHVSRIPNGVEFELFRSGEAANISEYPKDKPVVGYFGSIREWFDEELFLHTVEMRPDLSFVLIGETAEQFRTDLEKYDNVFALGRKPYEELPDYLATFDVCLLPFRITPLTEATNPVKLYEYFAQGKPVVSTNLPEVRQYESLCYIGSDEKTFLAGLDTAVREQSDSIRSNELIQGRVKIAATNSWDNRTEAFLQVLQPFGEPTLNANQLRRTYQAAVEFLMWQAEQRDRAWRLEYERVIEERDSLLDAKDRSWQQELIRQLAVQENEKSLLDEHWRIQFERLVSRIGGTK